MKSLLRASGISKRYGGLMALSDVTFAVDEGEFVAVIGPNGAGKSTFLNVLTGLALPTSGKVELAGIDITKASTHARIAKGLGRTFQHGRLFARMTVLENVMTGAAIRPRRSESELKSASLRVLERMGLSEVANHSVGALSYGQRRMVELCRALACEPKLLLLDEPAAGLHLGEVELLMDRLTALRAEQSLAVVLIEHNMGMVMRLAERILVLNFGCRIAEGSPLEVQNDPAVLSAYLGEGYNHARN